jgi:hypothetical protein
MVQTVNAGARETSNQAATSHGLARLPVKATRRGRPPKNGALSVPVKLRRLQIKLSPRGFERLEHLRSLTDAVSTVDVIRDALRVYEALAEAVASGQDVVLELREDPTNRERLKLW